MYSDQEADIVRDWDDRGVLFDYKTLDRGELELGDLRYRIGVRTRLGRSVLERNMHSGITDEQMAGRHEALEELHAKPELADQLDEYLQAVKQTEEPMSKFLERDYGGAYDKPRHAYRAGRQAITDLHQAASGIDPDDFEARHLSEAVTAIQDFGSSDVAKFAQGKVYRTPHGIQPHDSSWRRTPLRLGYNGEPSYPKIAAFGASVAGIGMATGRIMTERAIDPETLQTLASTDREIAERIGFTFGSVIFPVTYGLLNGAADLTHTPTFIEPVRRQLADDEGLHNARRAYAELDVVNGFAQFRRQVEENGYATTLPDIVTSDIGHTFYAERFINPLLAYDLDDGTAVDNDLYFRGQVHATGPNSGGKSTTPQKGVLQSQALAEAGGPVVAERAMLSRTDFMAYMTPSAPRQREDTGRFGHEMREVGVLFERATPDSLIGIDDCMDGTRYDERIDQVGDVMRGFHAVGSTTIVATHATEMVEQLASEGIGQQIQVEFDEAAGKPTHKFVPGVSTYSHADKVSAKVGMDRDSIIASLEKRGHPTDVFKDR